MCLVLLRLTRHDPTVQLWPYVDDLNLATDTVDNLLESIAYLREFESDFHLLIANHKTSAWTNVKRQKQMLEESTGFNVHERFSALGADWMLTRSSKPEHEREHRGIQECMRRLNRARHLPMKPEKLAPVISVGRLSLIDYVNLPSHVPYKQLSSPCESLLLVPCQGLLKLSSICSPRLP